MLLIYCRFVVCRIPATTPHRRTLMYDITRFNRYLPDKTHSKHDTERRAHARARPHTHTHTHTHTHIRTHTHTTSMLYPQRLYPERGRRRVRGCETPRQGSTQPMEACFSCIPWSPTHGCVGKAITPRRLGSMPRTIPKSHSSRATHYLRLCVGPPGEGNI